MFWSGTLNQELTTSDQHLKNKMQEVVQFCESCQISVPGKVASLFVYTRLVMLQRMTSGRVYLHLIAPGYIAFYTRCRLHGARR